MACNKFGHRGTLAHLTSTLSSIRYMCTWRGNYCFISYLCNFEVKGFTRIYAYLVTSVENPVLGNVTDISKSAKCVVLFQIAFTSINRGNGEIHGFLFQIVQIVSLVSEFLSFSITSFWQRHLLINKSNQLLVIVFHQSATGDTRENLDFAVERQNSA